MAEVPSNSVVADRCGSSVGCPDLVVRPDDSRLYTQRPDGSHKPARRGCDGGATLVTVDLTSGQVTGAHPVADTPDVLAYDWPRRWSAWASTSSSPCQCAAASTPRLRSASALES